MTTLAEAIALGPDAGIERSFHCHVHENSNTAAASVNVVLGVWVCFSCGAAGKTDGKVSRAQDVVRLAETMLSPQHQHHTLSEYWLDLFDAHHPSPYWVQRTSFDTAELFRCGTDPTTGSPTYPIRDAADRVLGVVCRQNGNPKYVYPPGVSVSRCLFGWQFRNKRRAQSEQWPLVIVEGATDVLALHAKLGVYAFGVYGAGVKQPQVAMLKAARRNSKETVLVAFDNDAAGRRATNDSIALLEEAGIRCARFPWGKFPNAKDIDEITDIEELRFRLLTLPSALSEV